MSFVIKSPDLFESMMEDMFSEWFFENYNFNLSELQFDFYESEEESYFFNFIRLSI